MPSRAELSRAPSWKDLSQRAGPSLAEPIRAALNRTDQSEAHQGEARKASWLGALAGGASWTLPHETQNGNFLTNDNQGMLPSSGRRALPHSGNNESSVLQHTGTLMWTAHDVFFVPAQPHDCIDHPAGLANAGPVARGANVLALVLRIFITHERLCAPNMACGHKANIRRSICEYMLIHVYMHIYIYICVYMCHQALQ